MSGSHPGWAETTLGEIGEYLNGRGFKKSEWRDAGRPIIRIQNLTGSRNQFNYFDGEPEEHYLARPGDLLVSWAATLGVFVWDGPEAVVNQHIFKVRSHIDHGFHRYLLLSVLGDLRRETHGSGMVHITKSRFERTSVHLPPLAEQRRIVAAIDEQLSRLDASVVALERADHNLTTMRNAVLQAAVSGRLGASDPTEPSLADRLQPSDIRDPLYRDQPKNWITTTISAIGEVSSGATPLRARSEYWADGSIPWITSTLVNQESISEAKEFVTPLALRETSIKLMPPGTLLVAMYGEGQTRGRCAELLIEATTNQACAAIVLHDDWTSVRRFLKLALMASYEANRRLSVGGVQPNLSVGTIKNLRISLPPPDEQQRICDEADRYTSLISKVRTELKSHRRRAAMLRSSILSAAISGTLASQDANDEPASALLDRIRATRASERGEAGRAHRRLRKVTA